MKKHIKKRILLLLLAIAILFCGYRIININLQYPEPKEEFYYMQEPVSYGSFEMAVTGYNFMSPQEISEVFANEISNDHAMKCLVLDLTVKNIGSDTEQIELYNFILES